MARMETTIEYSGLLASAKLGKRALQDILRKAMRASGLFWKRNYRADHFTTAGARKYGYAPRSGENQVGAGKFFGQTYAGRKLKEKKHNRPLVWSGESERRSAAAVVQAAAKSSTQAWFRVPLNAPALNFSSPERTVGSGQPVDKRKEATTVTDTEFATLVEVIKSSMVLQLTETPKQVVKI